VVSWSSFILVSLNKIKKYIFTFIRTKLKQFFKDFYNYAILVGTQSIICPNYYQIFVNNNYNSKYLISIFNNF